MQIIPIKINDALEVKILFRDVWIDTYPNKEEGITREDVDTFFSNQLSTENVEKFKQKLENINGNHQYLVVRIDNKIVGVSEVLKTEDENKINIICVHPEFQGRGIGFKLWKESLKFIDPTKPTTLIVARYNEKAIKFYERLGFTKAGVIPKEEEFILPSGKIIPEIKMVLR